MGAPRQIPSMSGVDFARMVIPPETLITRIMCEPVMKERDVTLVEALTALLAKPQQQIIEEVLALRSRIFDQEEQLRTYKQNHERQCAQIRVQKARIKRILLKWADFKARSVQKGFRYITSKNDRKDGMR